MCSEYERNLFCACDYEKINELSKVVFVEGHLEKLDDLMLVLLPLVNAIYYKCIRSLDDREYAKEDLISDAALSLYQDMYLRWDKYIHIEAYYAYYSRVISNTMIGLVHKYHNFYSIEDVDLELVSLEEPNATTYDLIESRLLRESLQKDILDTAAHIIQCRPVNTNLLLRIFNCIYVEKSGLESLKSRVRVLGISNTLFSFYCEHVRYAYKLSYNYHYANLKGKEKMMKRISETIGRFEDVTYKMIAENYYDTILPEIYAEFGADGAKKFVKTFSNRTIQVPDYKNFCDTLLGGIVLALVDGDRSNLYTVAEEYGIPYKTLSRIYNKASKYESQEKG